MFNILWLRVISENIYIILVIDDQKILLILLFFCNYEESKSWTRKTSALILVLHIYFSVILQA